jgi:hypothetical protein
MSDRELKENCQQARANGWREAVNVAHSQPRCGARTRKGTPCRGPAMPNGRCRMHGGASPGAPRGERNGNYRNGRYTKEALRRREEGRELRRRVRELLRSM